MGIRKSKLNTLWSAPDGRKKKEKVETRGGKKVQCNGEIGSLEGTGVRGLGGKRANVGEVKGIGMD